MIAPNSVTSKKLTALFSINHAKIEYDNGTIRYRFQNMGNEGIVLTQYHIDGMVQRQKQNVYITLINIANIQKDMRKWRLTK